MPEPKFLTNKCPEFPAIACVYSIIRQTAMEGELTKYATDKFLRLMEPFTGHKAAALDVVLKYSAISKANKVNSKTK